MPGFGINRLWWPGGRYAYVVRAFRRLHRPHPLHRRSEEHHQAGDRLALVAARHEPRRRREPTTPHGQARRAASHDHRRRSRLRRLARRRASPSTTSATRRARSCSSHINWSPPFPGGTHTPLPLPGRKLAVVADEANAEKCAKGTFHTWIVDVRAPENPVPIATLPTPRDRDYLRSSAPSARTTCTRTGPAAFQSEETIFATYNNAGVRVFDIRDAVRAARRSRPGCRRRRRR